MYTENVSDVSSWLSNAKYDKPVPLTTETKQDAQTNTEPKEGEGTVQAKVDGAGEGDTGRVQDDQPEALPEEVTNLFKKLLSKEDYELGYYKVGEGETEDFADIKTEQDALDFINVNVDARLEGMMGNLEEQWLASKSPVFQEIAHMAQLAGNDHTKLYRFLETQRNIEDYEGLDTKNPSDAELIVENYGRRRNDTPEVIAAEIKDLKERGKLEERAEVYKPVLVKDLNESKVKQKKDQELAEAQFFNTIATYDKEIRTLVGTKELAGMKVTTQDRDIVYKALSYDPEIGGFQIFKKIDDLQGQKKYDLLAKVAILIENEARYDELQSTRTKASVAAELQKKLHFNTKPTGEAGKDGKPVGTAAKPKADNDKGTKPYSPWGN